ncbi:ATP synthase F1 subunit gamma [Patescibacteria group bacterium]|nr:ATP synthase F1 subunit gamma [Patescibacteria group bacterium]MBU1705156.1 ATP synthase F1 subunit gamma [Patescibacteria group bacterium]
MALQTRAIKRRIKSVQNTHKITKAMELVAASKMRKAVQSVLGTRPFAQLAWDTVKTISSVTDTSMHPLLRERHDTKRTLLILLTSDRGLAGGFNNSMIRLTLAEIAKQPGEVDIIAVGKRGADAIKRSEKTLLASFSDITNNPRFEDVLPIGKLAVNEFLKGTYDKVLIGYTDFVSSINQKPLMLELLPLGAPESMKEIGEVGKKEPRALAELRKANVREYLFEPDAKTVLDRLLPRLIETMVYQAVLESAASEHSARMMAMRNASDAATDMIDSLTLIYNQARQAGITQEIAEISSGKAALEQNS